MRGTDRRFTSDPSQNVTPVWSPKGDRVVFRSDRGGHPGDLYQKAADGSGQDEPLLSTSPPCSCTRSSPSRSANSAGPKPGFEAGKPAPLFDSHIIGININYFNYDVTADGKRFLVSTSGVRTAPDGARELESGIEEITLDGR